MEKLKQYSNNKYVVGVFERQKRPDLTKAKQNKAQILSQNKTKLNTVRTPHQGLTKIKQRTRQ